MPANAGALAIKTRGAKGGCMMHGTPSKGEIEEIPWLDGGRWAWGLEGLGWKVSRGESAERGDWKGGALWTQGAIPQGWSQLRLQTAMDA